MIQNSEDLFGTNRTQKVINRTHCVGDDHTKTINIHTQNPDPVAIKMCKHNAQDQKDDPKAATDDVSYGIKNLFSASETWQCTVISLFHISLLLCFNYKLFDLKSKAKYLKFFKYFYNIYSCPKLNKIKFCT